MEFVFWGIALLALACFVTSLLPFWPGESGIFRVFDFPRQQTVALCIGGLAVLVAFFDLDTAAYVVVAMFGVSLAIQCFFIARFTPLWRRRSQRFDGVRGDAPTLRLLACNVKQGNTDKESAGDLITNHEPDIAIYLETDERWIDSIRSKCAHLPHQMEFAQDNGYGMFLASRIPLRNAETRFLTNEEVPSFHFDVTSHDLEGGSDDDGRTIRIIAVHPEPPVASAPTTGRDAELAEVGILVRDMGEDQPVLVCGDLNDVAWSRTTRRFLRVSRLLDPREGRGFYNSFDARFFFLRWPLDHLFHSQHFQLIGVDRLEHVGSDHFPMLFEVAFMGSGEPLREREDATEQDLEESKQVIEEEKERDRRPTGTDWETVDS